MENKELEMSAKKFEMVLEVDEKVVGVLKPQKTKYFVSNVLGFLTMTLIFAVLGVLVFLFPDEGYQPNVTGAIVVVAVYVVVVLFELLLAVVYYKNLYYAYTNKRIIIRSGIFGVDFKSLDMSMIGAVNVYVSLLDKLVHKNTGSVTFGSMASPMYGANGASNYRFSHIVAPYEVCKEIKAKIDEYKKSEK